MNMSCAPVIAASFPRLPHSPRHFGAAPCPIAPSCRPFAGAIPAAVDPTLDRSASTAAFYSFGRSGRPGRAAAYLADRALSAPSCLRVAPGEGAGKS